MDIGKKIALSIIETRNEGRDYTMDASEIAMKMEQDGEIFHRELAENTNNPGFRKMLAKDELKNQDPSQLESYQKD